MQISVNDYAKDGCKELYTKIFYTLYFAFFNRVLIESFKVNMTRKFLLMKNVNLSVLISNFDIKLSKTEPFFSYSLLKIKFLHKKVSGDLGRVFGLVT